MKISTYKNDDFLAFTSQRLNNVSREAYLNILANQLNISHKQLIKPEQTHSANIALANSIDDNLIQNTDGLISNTPNLCLCIQTADCTPIIFYDNRKKVCGVVHAGWRGTAKNISGKMIERFQSEFSSKPEHIKAIIGPCISQPIYQVGHDVYDAFKKLPYDLDAAFIRDGNEKYKLDLKLANRIIIESAGIKSHNITSSLLCTFTHNDRFYSARKEGIETGRIITGIMIK